MKRLWIALVASVAVVVVLVAGSGQGARGLGNPAALYCQKLGYQYEIVDTDEGQYGTCTFFDGSTCDDWRFLECRCGGEYSYCAIHGYDWITKTDGQNPYSRDYCVCVLDGEEIGAVTELVDVEEGGCCPPLDSDADGFPDSFEAYVGADPDDACADDPSDDAWPPDINNDTEVDIFDVLLYKPKLTGRYDCRYDLNADTSVDIYDVLMYKQFLHTSCTNP
jgi:putative hemolysin